MNIPDKYQLLFWIACLILTIYITCRWTIRAYLRRRAIRLNGEQAVATIIKYETIELFEEPEKQTFYRYYLEFVTKAGEKVVVQPDDDKQDKFAVGTNLTVYFLSKDPQQFYIKDFWPFQARIIPVGIIVASYSIYNIVTIFLRHV